MIKLANDTIDREDIDSLIEWLKTYPRLTKGDLTIQYEKKWSKYLGSQYSVFVNSGSAANLLMLYCLLELSYIKRDDKVVVPTLSWSTDLAPVIQLGLEPVLCDCNLDNLSVDLEHLENIFKKEKPKVLMLVSVLGLVPNMQEIAGLCNKHGVILLEDTCESLGSEHEGKKLGSFGLMSSFSTYFGHHISTIEGGMVCTDDKKIFNVLKSLRSHGWDRDMDSNIASNLRKKYNVDEFNALYTFFYSGFNMRATDLQAYIGLEQLDKIELIAKKRSKNYDMYNELIKNDFWMPIEYNNRYVSNFAYPIIHPKRDEIVRELNKNNIENRPLICGTLSRQPFWVKRYGELTLKNANIVHDFGLYVPNNHQIKVEEIRLISETVNWCTK